MNQMKWIGGVIFLILAFVGYNFFTDYSKKAHAKAEAEAVRYLMSLIKEDTSININQATGGPVVHPWMLAQNPSPSQVEIEEKVALPRVREEEWFTWTLKGDPDGGTNVRELKVSAKYDQQGVLQSLKGLKGTVSFSAAQWEQ